jgi:nitroimidazol reductase NimA-like FMN-containing flavoprotein (pyridoxamine 5'-phosphate oxidase superfamily)
MKTSTTVAAHSTPLSALASRALLRRSHVGRIGYLSEGRVDIEPVSYAASGDWIFIRSAAGAKMAALAHAPYVAFEVDEVRTMTSWQSVVVHGTVYLMSDHGAGPDRRVFEKALAALRSFLPQTLRDGDPVPFRNTVYGIHIDRITGRQGPRSRRPRRAAPRTRSVARARRRPAKS